MLIAVASVAGCASPTVPAPIARTSIVPETNAQPAVGTKRKDLVYVSAGTSVLVSAYLSGTVLEKLQDFTDARGSCVDASGNVYVTNDGAADILEFAHGATTPTRILIDPDAYPIDCSIDPKTGNLAVLNEYGKIEYSPGSVAVYAGAKGRPKLYTDTAIHQFTACGYDGSGDLIVSGYTANFSLSMVYLPAGSNALQPFSMPLGYGWEAPAYARWDGRYLVVAFSDHDDASVFVQYAISGNTGTQEGTTITFYGVANGPFWVGKTGRGKKQTANTVGAATDEGVYFWSFPEGSPLYRLQYDQDDYGTGVSVSPAQ